MDDKDYPVHTIRGIGSPHSTPPGYENWRIVVESALEQAVEGKGKRHYQGQKAWDEQPIMQITEVCGIGFPIGQAMKKLDECLRMEPGAQRRELLGALNYVVAAVIKCNNDASRDERRPDAVSADPE